jgi:pimeloyl-ACP methyl ester carboxylesterase
MDLGRRFFLKTARCAALHGRHFGSESGVPIVLLHASPMSSKTLAPLANALVEADPNLCVIAFDTPGFGHSSPLTQNGTAVTLTHFAGAFFEALSLLGIIKTAVYGAATGAQIAIEMAVRKPQRISLLIADGACHFEPEQRGKILASYFPSLAPVVSGAHLTQAAHMARALFEFFPWFETTEAHRLPGPVPSGAVLHDLARAYLSASPSYDIAYRLAFENERFEQIAKLRVNTWIARWPNSILLPYTDALLAHALPSNVQTLSLQAGATRYDEIAQHCAKLLADGAKVEFKIPVHKALLVLELTYGSMVLSRHMGDQNSLPLGGSYFHLPGLGLGELYGDTEPDIDDWRRDTRYLIEHKLDVSFGADEIRLAALASVHTALDQQPALAVLEDNAELLQTWNTLSQSALGPADSAALSPTALQLRLNATLDLARLKAHLLEHAI